MKSGRMNVLLCLQINGLNNRSEAVEETVTGLCRGLKWAAIGSQKRDLRTMSRRLIQGAAQVAHACLTWALLKAAAAYVYILKRIKRRKESYVSLKEIRSKLTDGTFLSFQLNGWYYVLKRSEKGFTFALARATALWTDGLQQKQGISYVTFQIMLPHSAM